MKKVIEYIQDNHDRYIGELNEFLRIPSVSTDPEHKKDVRIAADFVGKQLREAGIKHFFPKPFNIADLPKAIEEAMAG